MHACVAGCRTYAAVRGCGRSDVLPLTFPESSLGEGDNAPDKVAAKVAALHNGAYVFAALPDSPHRVVLTHILPAAELRGLIAMEAQVTFLNKTKVFAAYGCDFFPCKRTWKSRDERASEERVKMRTEEVIVAVGKEGIHLWPTGDAVRSVLVAPFDDRMPRLMLPTLRVCRSPCPVTATRSSRNGRCPRTAASSRSPITT